MTTLIAAVFLGALTTFIVWANVFFYRKDRDGSWRPHGIGVRRWRNGAWEYRPMTAAEKHDNTNPTGWD